MPQVPQAGSGWANRGRTATDGLSARAFDFAHGTLDLCGRVPSAVVRQIRQRVNVLDLATRNDVEAQSKLGRNRVSYVLNEFLETQRGHEEQLVESLRNELHEELQSFAAAISDDLFAMRPSQPEAAPLDKYSDADDDEEDEDDELFDLELEFEAGEEFDIDDLEDLDDLADQVE